MSVYAIKFNFAILSEFKSQFKSDPVLSGKKKKNGILLKENKKRGQAYFYVYPFWSVTMCLF
jgi:hypothetical protein